MKILSRNYTRIIISVVITIAIIYLMIYIDVILRARDAYLEGEKYWSWYENPASKEIELKKELQNEISQLDKKLAKRKITKDEYDRKIEIEKFNFDRKLEESSIKYAYIWYQTVVELFSPPESKWVKLARKKMPLAKEKWKQELQEKNIPFEEYMLK